MADEPKKTTPEEKEKNAPPIPGKSVEPPAPEPKAVAPVSEPVKKAPEKGAPPVTDEKAKPVVKDEKSRPGNVIEITGAMIDKLAAEKVAKGAAKQPGQARPTMLTPEPKKPVAKPDTSKKAPEKVLPAASDVSLAEKKKKLEQELREKYGIPKSDKPVKPWVAPEVEQVVRIPHEKLHPFKDHPFNVDKTTAKFKAFVASIRAHGVTQPVIVRPNGQDGYEIVSGHRRDAGGIEAEIPYTPCIIRELNDDQAIQQMVEDNVNNREITVMELARALKKQLDSIKHQGARQALDGKDFTADIDKRSNEIVAERNGMSVKQVQRHIALTSLIKPIQELVDGKMTDDGKALKISFTPAVELSYIRPKNQEYIAVAIEGQQSTPSLAQAQRMRELDKKGLLNGDMIDGIMLEEKKEVDRVIISGAELDKYFGKDKTPKEMKEQIIKLLDDWKGQQKEQTRPEKAAAKEK